MHFYWRVIEELKLIGETWVFSDPSLARSFEYWLYKNADAIAMLDISPKRKCPPLFDLNGMTHSLN